MTESENIPRRYWGIQEASEVLCEPPSKIRFWCKFFGIAPIREGGNRKFVKHEIERLSAIKAYVAEGYKLKAIKNKI